MTDTPTTAPGLELNARYDGNWYYCWLIERLGTSQPQWWGADCTWKKNAQDAEWYARKADAEEVAGEMAEDCYVCEHGFDMGIGPSASPAPGDTPYAVKPAVSDGHA